MPQGDEMVEVVVTAPRERGVTPETGSGLEHKEPDNIPVAKGAAGVRSTVRPLTTADGADVLFPFAVSPRLTLGQNLSLMGLVVFAAGLPRLGSMLFPVGTDARFDMLFVALVVISLLMGNLWLLSRVMRASPRPHTDFADVEAAVRHSRMPVVFTERLGKATGAA